MTATPTDALPSAPADSGALNVEAPDSGALKVDKPQFFFTDDDVTASTEPLASTEHVDAAALKHGGLDSNRGTPGPTITLRPSLNRTPTR